MEGWEGRWKGENIVLPDLVSWLKVWLMLWFVNRVKRPLKVLLVALFL